VRKSTDHRAAGDAPSRAQGAGLSFSGPARIQIGRVLSLRFVARPTLDGARVGSLRAPLYFAISLRDGVRAWCQQCPGGPSRPIHSRRRYVARGAPPNLGRTAGSFHIPTRIGLAPKDRPLAFMHKSEHRS
jgi:hypothetical protein